jgi:tetratricopeptide (TPR) repeat protein
MTDPDRAMVRDFIGIFSKLSDRAEAAKTSPSPSPSPTTATAPPAAPKPRLTTSERPDTATGWLELARKQPPAEAVASIREALILSPGWIDAEAALCAALAATKDAAALPACTTALEKRPDDILLLSHRSSAYVRTGRPREGLADLDKIIAKNPAPTWLRVRARVREMAGDEKGARADLERSCELGHQPTCREIGK